MNVGERHKIENRSSDTMKLSVQARIMNALMRSQPQQRDKLIKNAGISKSSFYRNYRVLMKKGIMKKTSKGYALSSYVERPNLWTRLKDKIAKAGGGLEEITVQRASFAGRDHETGQRKYGYDLEDSIKGIVVLKGAIEFVNAARSEGVYIEDKYDGTVLTSNPIEHRDHLLLKSKLFEVRDVEEKIDDFSFRVAKLILGKEKKEPSHARPPSMVDDARSQVRTFLTTHLTAPNIVRDDGSTEALHSVIYLNPDYDIIKEEFRVFSNPLDGLYAIGEPQREPMYDIDQTIYGYNEHVPIFIYTIDKVGVTGTKLKRRMEVELWRVCEAHRIGNQLIPRLERRGDTHEQRGSTIVYSTEFVLNYARPVRKSVT
ncbi:MAG: hypothetical protein JSV12_01340 [Candidatus Bathyarchaeota archaeon]|nr:MAG: hypothetical protein JSV12_01340 [Candidatus Bathyarchaeota archaeon]